MIGLAAFLGNPGEEYRGNRHNAGRLLAETLPFFPSLDWKKKFKGLYATVEGDLLRAYAGPAQGTGENPGGPPEKVHLLLPETYMNLSGDSVLAAAAFFKIKPDRILVIHDELELSLGQVSLKFSGGLGGHNGLRSMKARFGTADFWRLRIGIGRPGHDDISGWVLSDFSPPERTVLGPVLEAAAGVLIQALVFGPQGLLPEWNKKKIDQTGP
ncbi:MAG: aminoacyl-tRNA hydrolase [Spirochaetaceae bacterium]|jgi:PTH1 family peptidyl-tRNA hydrolase|nr:aminoacyl-tRNA hydrolase [Spirochaetaceae bacterium]